jgi:hypothetical protein
MNYRSTLIILLILPILFACKKDSGRDEKEEEIQYQHLIVDTVALNFSFSSISIRLLNSESALFEGSYHDDVNAFLIPIDKLSEMDPAEYYKLMIQGHLLDDEGTIVSDRFELLTVIKKDELDSLIQISFITTVFTSFAEHLQSINTVSIEELEEYFSAAVNKESFSISSLNASNQQSLHTTNYNFTKLMETLFYSGIEAYNTEVQYFIDQAFFYRVEINSLNTGVEILQPNSLESHPIYYNISSQSCEESFEAAIEFGELIEISNGESVCFASCKGDTCSERAIYYVTSNKAVEQQSVDVPMSLMEVESINTSYSKLNEAFAALDGIQSNIDSSIDSLQSLILSSSELTGKIVIKEGKLMEIKSDLEFLEKTKNLTLNPAVTTEDLISELDGFLE